MSEQQILVGGPNTEVRGVCGPPESLNTQEKEPAEANNKWLIFASTLKSVKIFRQRKSAAFFFYCFLRPSHAASKRLLRGGPKRQGKSRSRTKNIFPQIWTYLYDPPAAIAANSASIILAQFAPKMTFFSEATFPICPYNPRTFKPPFFGGETVSVNHVARNEKSATFVLPREKDIGFLG